MYLINLMEQKVSKLADSYFNDKNIPVNSNMRMDIIAYTLNRVNPQYVTSARGVLHSYDRDPIQTNTDILSIIADACEIVTRRKENKLLESVPSIDESGYYLTYPSIIGNITSSCNFDKVDNALVYIFDNKKILQGYGVNFPNPAVVSSNVPGKFMFCFMPKKVMSAEEIEVKLDIIVESEKYVQYKNVLTFNLKPLYYNEGDMPLFSIEEVNDILLIENQDISN